MRPTEAASEERVGDRQPAADNSLLAIAIATATGRLLAQLRAGRDPVTNSGNLRNNIQSTELGESSDAIWIVSIRSVCRIQSRLSAAPTTTRDPCWRQALFRSVALSFCLLLPLVPSVGRFTCRCNFQSVCCLALGNRKRARSPASFCIATEQKRHYRPSSILLRKSFVHTLFWPYSCEQNNGLCCAHAQQTRLCSTTRARGTLY